MPYETREPAGLAALRRKYPILQIKMDVTMRKSRGSWPFRRPREHGFFGFERLDGKEMRFIDMPPAEFVDGTWGKIPYIPPSMPGYVLRVIYHTHPFLHCNVQCFPDGHHAPFGPSEDDLKLANLHPNAFSVIGHLEMPIYYGPRMLQ